LGTHQLKLIERPSEDSVTGLHGHLRECPNQGIIYAKGELPALSPAPPIKHGITPFFWAKKNEAQTSLKLVTGN
jgi:hypothetical protein